VEPGALGRAGGDGVRARRPAAHGRRVAAARGLSRITARAAVTWGIDDAPVPPTKDFVRFLAAWALLHESADEAWLAAVARGRASRAGEPAEAGEPFADALAALVADEKDRLRVELASGAGAVEPAGPDLASALAELRFELAELRGRVESLQASVDAVAAHLRERGPAGDGG
jgi:hypothetical protein